MTIQAAQHLGQFERVRTSIIGLGFPLPAGLAMNPLFTLDQMSATQKIHPTDATDYPQNNIAFPGHVLERKMASFIL